MKNHYDVLIFGAGPAGTAVAYGLAGKKSVLVIENDLFGGTCPNRGCDPKKMLYSAVQTRDRVSRMQGSGLKNVPQIDWPDLMAFKRAYTSQIPAGTRKGLVGAGIETYHGRAKLVDQHQVQLADHTTISADNVVLATGRQPQLPDIPGRSLLKTSNDFLDLDALPKHITFIGAGLVAMELANIASQAGVKTDRQGILVDDHLRTSVDGIYAAGDVVAKPQPKLTPVASFEGRYVADSIMGKATQPIQYPVIPRILFGTTEIGQAGVSYQEALAHPDQYRVSSLDLTHWYTYNRVKDNAARAILIRSTKSGRLVGFAGLSAIGEQLLNLLTTVLNLKLTNNQIQHMIFAYPSVASDLQYLV